MCATCGDTGTTVDPDTYEIIECECTQERAA